MLQCFATNRPNLTKLRMLFSAVLMNIPNSKVCLKGESSIELSSQQGLVASTDMVASLIH